MYDRNVKNTPIRENNEINPRERESCNGIYKVVACVTYKL